MILYVNGDSHSAGAEAVNKYAFAKDDPLYYALGNKPHPDNLKASYGTIIANYLNAILECDAESASSIDRIIRTSHKYLKTHTPDLIIIGWPTSEREEWLYNGVYYQINSSGTTQVPNMLKKRYTEWIAAGVDWPTVTKNAHDRIYQFHLELQQQRIPHLFFNCYSDFHTESQVDWHNSYIDPYDTEMTYWKWLFNQGYISSKWYHYDARAHYAWATFLINHLTKIPNESIITT